MEKLILPSMPNYLASNAWGSRHISSAALPVPAQVAEALYNIVRGADASVVT
jgi:hypothetical protein